MNPIPTTTAALDDARDRRTSRAASGGEHEPVERQHLARGEADRPPVGVDPLRRRAEAPLDLRILVETRLLDARILGPLLPPEHALRQGRSLEG